MATAAERTQIIGLVVGMVGAAPGATILAELETLFDAGLSLEEMAVAISVNAAFNGDAGLYPAFLPNAIFATNWVTDLIGDEVSAANLQLAIDAVTAELNAGTSRGAIMFAAITAVGAVDPSDPDFGAAAQALLNKTEVAEYYSVTVAQSGATIADLQAAIAGVDSTAASVTAANAAIDTVIAENADLADLVANLTAANAAKAAFLAEADGDGNPLTSTSDAQIVADRDAAEGLVDADPEIGAGYIGGSAGLKAALIADAAAADAVTLAGLNTALAAALNTTAGTGSVTGLDAAIAVYNSAAEAAVVAFDAEANADLALTEAAAAYGIAQTPNEGAAAPVGTDGAFDDAGANPLITYNAVSMTLSLASGVTESSNPGVTALLAASQAYEAAQAALIAADAAEASALDVVENLDPGAGAVGPLSDVGNGMTVITPADVDAPTIAEITAETNGLDSLLTAANAAAVASATYAAADLDGSIALITTDLDAAGSIAAVEAITATAVSEGLITSADKVAIDAVADGAANGTESAVLATENASARDTAFDGLTATYFGTGGVALAMATSPLSFAAAQAAAAVAAEQLAQATLAANIADEQEAQALIEESGELDDAIQDAEDAFADAGFAVPVSLTLAVHAATNADDLFTAADTTTQIISFGGDDVLFIGEGLTLNADTTPGDNGDNAVLEYWVSGTTNAVITIETSVFGSEATTPETFTITLTGVAASSVSIEDGFLTVS